MNDLQALNEICQFNKLLISYECERIGGGDHCPRHHLKMKISDENMCTICKLGCSGVRSQKALRQYAATKLMSDPPANLIPYIEAKRIGRTSDPIEENKYVQWGVEQLKDYNLYINDLKCLDMFIGKDIAVDSEGFPPGTNGGTARLIQLADHKTVGIFDYVSFQSQICDFLRTKTLIMCDAHSDMRMLKLPSNTRFVDIQEIYRHGPDSPVKSLKRLAGEMVNKTFQRPDGTFYNYHKWDINNLDRYHQIYAATDAIATYRLFSASFQS
tara:strand:- start:305 stop:1114 length:810 start_codon:yes stop_codon:yes gene_type:complete